MVGLFKDIVIDCHRDKLMASLLNYYRDEKAEYLDYLQVLDSAIINLRRSIPPVWEPFQGSITPNPIASLTEHIPVFESEVTNLSQKEQSNCMLDENMYYHLRLFQVHPHALNIFQYLSLMSQICFRKNNQCVWIMNTFHHLG